MRIDLVSHGRDHVHIIDTDTEQQERQEIMNSSIIESKDATEAK